MSGSIRVFYELSFEEFPPIAMLRSLSFDFANRLMADSDGECFEAHDEDYDGIAFAFLYLNFANVLPTPPCTVDSFEFRASRTVMSLTLCSQRASPV